MELAYACRRYGGTEIDAGFTSRPPALPSYLGAPCAPYVEPRYWAGGVIFST
jgi:hypothetical protein